MQIVFNTPLNRVSFGQVSIGLIKQAFKEGHEVFIVPIGPLDLSTVKVTPEFKKNVDDGIQRGTNELDPAMKAIKLWHLAIPDEHLGVKGCYERYCDDTSFISFYELDKPTPVELNVARAFDMIFTSNYTCQVFKDAGVKSRFIPLAFDSDHFNVVKKRYFPDDRIAFAMLGKFEQRKHHAKMIKAWVKRFGNDKRYYLQLAVYNPFFPPQMNMNVIAGSMEGKRYWNVNPMQWVPTNEAYNDFLNSNHIVLGMSGGEGWGLPEFHSVGLGKHAVILNAHSYQDWATDENAVLVSPLNKIPAADGVFFKEGAPLNQGNIFSWDDDEFIAACEAAIERHKANPVNEAGLKIQENFTYEKTLKALLNP